MRPCLNLITVFRANLEEAVGAAAAAGFEAVELWVDSLERYLEKHSVDDLRRLLDSHGVDAVGIGDIESITFCDPGQFDELFSRCERLASVAGAISCPTLVASASVRPHGADFGRLAEEAASALGRLLDAVEPHGVGLALAFRGFNWCAVNTLELAMCAVDSHNGRRAGLALDTFDLHATGVDPQQLKSIDPNRILMMRLSDCEDVHPAILSEACRALPGEGAADLDEMLQAVCDAGYDGDISMKIPSPKLIGLDPVEAAKVVMTVSDKYLPGARARHDFFRKERQGDDSGIFRSG